MAATWGARPDPDYARHLLNATGATTMHTMRQNTMTTLEATRPRTRPDGLTLAQKAIVAAGSLGALTLGTGIGTAVATLLGLR